MSDIPSDLKYTKQHEWVRVEGDLATVGITDYAQESLGDITFIELPNVGDSIEAHESLGVIESVKAASDIYMPVGGEITEINESLEDAPENANNDPYGEGWIVKIKLSAPSDLDALLDASAYEAETAG